MIETFLIDFLNDKLVGVPAYAEEPESVEERYIIIERTAGHVTNCLNDCTIAVQSYGPTMFDAMMLNEQVKAVMDELNAEPAIAGCHLNSDYNYTDTSTHRYRYQAVYDITYYSHMV